eukprot:1265519-Prymnesium_polylepis.1
MQSVDGRSKTIQPRVARQRIALLQSVGGVGRVASGVHHPRRGLTGGICRNVSRLDCSRFRARWVQAVFS